MAYSLPPMNTLRIFEAAARHLSFSLAAKELFLTHGAVSKQIKQLENDIGCALFVRQHRQVSLTTNGQRYLVNIQAALQTISRATEELRAAETDRQSISINVLPSLTINWLIPRMEQFKQRYPHLYVDLSIGDFKVDFNLHRYDIAIRSATTPPKDCQYVKLMDEDLCLVCSPHIAKQLQSLEDINRVTLLKHTTRPELWPFWSEQVGIALFNEKNFGMEHFYMLSQAAVSGMGIALIPRFFIEEQLSDGSLVIPFDNQFTSPYSYYLQFPSAAKRPVKVQAFIDWLLEIFSPYRH
ncbi:LysR substrate-binding domain-containing protein [Shewanella waksmanii]|uniref:LysR substrate-binding domain-containing protein n=1 Tax=Shewanella waksmanii TaxID=213783 RepID=UPI003735073E